MTSTPRVAHDNIVNMLNIFYFSTNVPLEFVDVDHAQPYMRLPASSPHLPSDLETRIQRKALRAVRQTERDTFVALEDDYYQQYLACGVWREDRLVGCLLAGPMLTNPVDQDKEKDLKLEHSLALLKQLEKHYDQIPHRTYQQYKYVGVFLQHLDCMHPTISAPVVEQEMDEDPILVEPSMKPDFSRRSIEAKREEGSETVDHHPYELEQEFLEALTNGDRSFLKKLAAFDQYPIPSIGNGDPLRSYKNILICAVAVTIRSVQQKGLDFEQLSSFADAFINRIEATDHIPGLTRLYYELHEQLFDLVDEHLTQRYSRTVYSCIRYMRQHLSDPLSLQSVSKEIGVHPGYLSTIFKQETAQTFSDFMARERVSKAKRYLIYTDEPILYIADYVGYHNQSYFTRVFKKYVGLTPKQYRLATVYEPSTQSTDI